MTEQKSDQNTPDPVKLAVGWYIEQQHIKRGRKEISANEIEDVRAAICEGIGLSTIYSAAAQRPKPNATFYSFKASGKWYATGRGVLTEEVFKVFSSHERWHQIIRDNGGCYPGLAGNGKDFVLVIFADDEVPFGFPLMLNSEK